jgi:hypothetical protein
MDVVLMVFEVLRELLNASREKRHLHFAGARVEFIDAIFFNYFLFTGL